MSVGFFLATYAAMDYLGDAAGYNSEDLAFRWVASFANIGTGTPPFNIQGGRSLTASNRFWQIFVNANGSIEFDLRTSAFAWKWTVPAASVPATSAVYTIIFLLTGGGETGQFYIALRTAAATAAITTTRATLATATVSTVGSQLFRLASGGSSGALSHAGIYIASGGAALAAQLHNEFKDAT